MGLKLRSIPQKPFLYHLAGGEKRIKTKYQTIKLNPGRSDWVKYYVGTQVMSIHKRWMVYRGNSTEKSNVLFTVKDSKYWQLRPNLDVFLASNPNENECDFHLEGRNSNQTCTIYKGDTVIAEVTNYLLV